MSCGSDPTPRFRNRRGPIHGGFRKNILFLRIPNRGVGSEPQEVVDAVALGKRAFSREARSNQDQVKIKIKIKRRIRTGQDQGRRCRPQLRNGAIAAAGGSGSALCWNRGARRKLLGCGSIAAKDQGQRRRPQHAEQETTQLCRRQSHFAGQDSGYAGQLQQALIRVSQLQPRSCQYIFRFLTPPCSNQTKILCPMA